MKKLTAWFFLSFTVWLLSSPVAQASEWAGSWKGSVECVEVVQSDEGANRQQGQVEIDIQFSEEGYLLYRLPNGEVVTLNQEGLVKRYALNPGIGELRVLQVSRSDKNQTYGLGYAHESTQNDANSSNTTHEQGQAQFVFQRLSGAEMDMQIEEQAVSQFYFSSPYGSGRSVSATQRQCKGKLSQQ